MQLEKFSYDNQVVKQFMVAAVIFAVVGMLVGLIIAIQLYIPELNLGLQYITFGRIRPLHTNAVFLHLSATLSSAEFIIRYSA